MTLDLDALAVQMVLDPYWHWYSHDGPLGPEVRNGQAHQAACGVTVVVQPARVGQTECPACRLITYTARMLGVPSNVTWPGPVVR